MKKLALHWQVIIALLLGVLVAWLAIRLDAGETDPEAFSYKTLILHYIKPWGDIFIRVLKLIAVPLVLFSIITGVASLKDIKKLGSIGVKTLLTYVLTTIAAVLVGLTVVNIGTPGERVDESTRIKNRISYELWRNENDIQKLDDINLAADAQYADIVKELQSQEGEELNEWVTDKLDKAEKEKKAKAKDGPLKPLVDVVPSNIFKALGDMSMLQIIFFAIFAGVALVMIDPKYSEPVLQVSAGLGEMLVQMILIVMKAMPFFVFCLMAGQIIKVAGADEQAFLDLLQFLVKYSITVIIGLAFMIFIFYPGLIQILVKKIGAFKFMKGMRIAQVTAFSTSSSLATLPVTMDCVHDNLGVSERTTSFVLPVGATINMDGTSLYQAVAVVAMAQFHMVDLTLAQQATIVITATLASIGAAAIPSAGLVLMILVLESVGLNPAWIALIFPVDRLLDMCRTVVNVTGDGAVSTIIANSEGELGEAQDLHPG